MDPLNIRKIAAKIANFDEEFEDEEFDSGPEFEFELTEMLKKALNKGYTVQGIHDICQRLLQSK